ncbi:MAG: ABC transporter substrate-binding protein, partial [Ralstonia mannitolilytica]
MTTRRRRLFDRICGLALFAGAAAIALPAHADIRVGVVLSSTGPAAAIGIPSKNTVQMWPATIGGQRAQVIILDDASDPSVAVRDVRKLIAEEKVDVIVGPTIAPTALASLDAVAEGQTPMVALAASASIVEPQDAKRHWAFKMPQNESHMATLVTQHMADTGVRPVGF